MSKSMPLDDLVANGKLNYIDTDKIDDLLSLFEMHKLIPKLSKHEHAFANTLAMLVVSLQWNGNASHLFESLPYVYGREIDLLDIVNTMTHLGFTSHNLNMNINDIDQRLMPCLIIPDRKNASPLVLLYKEESGLIRAFHGRKKQIVEFVAKDFTGEVYFFEKNNLEEMEEDKQIKTSAGLSWFRAIFEKFRPIINQIILISTVINLLSLAMPIFIMSIYNTVIGSGSVLTLDQLLWGVGIAIVSEFILRLLRVRMIIWLGVRLDYIVSNTIFERLLLMKAAYTEGASISAQISRIKTFESVRKFFTGPLFTVIIELPFTVILLTAIWVLAGSLVLIPLIVMVLFALMLKYYQSKLHLSMRTSARASTHRQELGMETFIKMHSLHHNGMARSWWLRYKEKLAYSSIASFKTSLISAMIESAAHSISILSGVAIVTYGIHLIWDKSITTGALVATIMLVWRILGPLQTLCSMLPRIEQLKNSIDQINKLVTIEVEHEPTVLKKPIEHIDGNVKINNLGLRYSMDVEPVFVGLDIDVRPGEVVAITGNNGSGKSSILKLISGLYQPQTGTVRIDGVNIKQMEAIELRKYTAYLSQVPNFFEGTIRENLLLANPLATDEMLVQALKDSSAYDDLQNMEKGLDTIIYSHNSSFPSGYAYVLNLARVMLKKSNLMLLDELPNAALNEAVGSAYKKLIEDSKGKRTVFFVTQRDDFIKLADKVIVLKTGTSPLVMTSNEFINQYGK